MSVAGTRPIIDLASRLIGAVARILPMPATLSFYVVALVVGLLLGSFITEPAAITVTALILREPFTRGGRDALPVGIAGAVVRLAPTEGPGQVVYSGLTAKYQLATALARLRERGDREAVGEGFADFGRRKQPLTPGFVVPSPECGSSAAVLHGGLRPQNLQNVRRPNQVVQALARSDGKDLGGLVWADHGPHHHQFTQRRQGRP